MLTGSHSLLHYMYGVKCSTDVLLVLFIIWKKYRAWSSQDLSWSPDVSRPYFQSLGLEFYLDAQSLGLGLEAQESRVFILVVRISSFIVHTS